MSRFIRNTIASVMNATGLSALIRHARRDTLVILCYHRVLPDVQRDAYPFRDLVVTPDAFEAHMTLCTKHYECLTLRDAVDKLQRGAGHNPLLAITFDDGYMDNYEQAMPILAANDVQATFFVVTSRVGSSKPLWYDQLARTTNYLADQHMRSGDWLVDQDEALAQWLISQDISGSTRPGRDLVQRAKTISPNMRDELVEAISWRALQIGYRDRGADQLMAAKQLRDLVEAGHEVGSHTCSHPMLTQLSPQNLSQQLCKSKAELERMIRSEVVSLAYPNGDYNEQVLQATSDAGYLHAVTTQSGLNDKSTHRLNLDRIMISQERLSYASGKCATHVMQMELNGTADLLFLRHLRAHR